MMILVKKLKIFAFCMTAGLMLGGCSSGHEPMEIYTSGQEEGRETAETVKVLAESWQESREDGVEDRGNGIAADSGYGQGDRIEEQTFDVNLRPLGQVTFASYEPDTSANALADVVFRIEKEGRVLSELPGTSEDNIGLEMFNQVEAVSFTDYNNDGYDDIIAIISYYQGTGPQAASHSLIRYYKGAGDGSFVYEAEMSDAASSALAEITIQTAKDFMGPKRVGIEDGAGDNGQGVTNPEPWQQAFAEYLDKESQAEAQRGYTLIDMDDDEIPELVEVGIDEATGSRIIYYGKGKVQVAQLNRLYFDYIPGGNLLRNAEGLMDYYYDLVFSIVGGEMKMVASGYYGAADNTKRQFDAEGNPIYQYEWNGVEMSREEYERELSNVYDTSKAISYDYDKLYTVDEIKRIIEGY